MISFVKFLSITSNKTYKMNNATATKQSQLIRPIGSCKQNQLSSKGPNKRKMSMYSPSRNKQCPGSKKRNNNIRSTCPSHRPLTFTLLVGMIFCTSCIMLSEARQIRLRRNYLENCMEVSKTNTNEIKDSDQMFPLPDWAWYICANKESLTAKYNQIFEGPDRLKLDKNKQMEKIYRLGELKNHLIYNRNQAEEMSRKLINLQNKKKSINGINSTVCEQHNITIHDYDKLKTYSDEDKFHYTFNQLLHFVDKFEFNLINHLNRLSRRDDIIRDIREIQYELKQSLKKVHDAMFFFQVPRRDLCVRVKCLFARKYTRNHNELSPDQLEVHNCYLIKKYILYNNRTIDMVASMINNLEKRRPDADY